MSLQKLDVIPSWRMSNWDFTLSSWHPLTAVFSTDSRCAMEDDQLAMDLPYPLSALHLAVNAMLLWLNHFSYVIQDIIKQLK